MDKHEAVCLLKDLAIELGHTPSSKEFRARCPHSERYVNQFGGYNLLVMAAGLTPNRVFKEKKINHSIFEVRDMRTFLDSQPSTKRVDRPIYPRIASISDIHFPFEDQVVLDAFYAFLAQHGADYVILNGDAWDMYSHSRFPRSHNIFTPREEERLSRERNELFWKKIREIVPESKLFQLMGNHDIRAMKRVLEVYPEAEDWIQKRINELFTFEGVTTIQDPREELIIGDIAIFHGYRSKLGDHRDYTHMNCINGHTHKGGAVYRQIKGHVLWELNSGLSGNPLAKGLTYTPQKITEWTPGFGYVFPWGPQFVPA